MIEVDLVNRFSNPVAIVPISSQQFFCLRLTEVV